MSNCPCPPMLFWKKTGSHKKWIWGQKSRFLKRALSAPNHVPAITVKSCENKSTVLFSQINISLLPFFNFFWQKMDFGPILRFWPQRKNGCFSVSTLRIFFNEYIFLVQTHVRWDYRGQTGGNLNELVQLLCVEG